MVLSLFFRECEGGFNGELCWPTMAVIKNGWKKKTFLKEIFLNIFHLSHFDLLFLPRTKHLTTHAYIVSQIVKIVSNRYT